MADDTPSDGHAACVHCGATLPDQARYCAACGRAVNGTPDQAVGPAAGPAGPLAVEPSGPAAASSPRREALITVLVLLVAGLLVAGVAFSGRLPLVGGPSVPPSGEIWFGDTYDSTTFVLQTRWSSTTAGRPMAAVAHLATAVGAGEATLHIVVDGTAIANQPLTGLVGRGDLIGLTFTPPDPGAYTFTITATDGTTLAAGTISVS